MSRAERNRELREQGFSAREANQMSRLEQQAQRANVVDQGRVYNDRVDALPNSEIDIFKGRGVNPQRPHSFDPATGQRPRLTDDDGVENDPAGRRPRNPVRPGRFIKNPKRDPVGLPNAGIRGAGSGNPRADSPFVDAAGEHVNRAVRNQQLRDLGYSPLEADRMSLQEKRAGRLIAGERAQVDSKAWIEQRDDPAADPDVTEQVTANPDFHASAGDAVSLSRDNDPWLAYQQQMQQSQTLQPAGLQRHPWPPQAASANTPRPWRPAGPRGSFGGPLTQVAPRRPAIAWSGVQRPPENAGHRSHLMRLMGNWA